jgi:hypothetical protein
MHKFTGFAIGLLFALVVTIIVILLVRKSSSGLPKLPDLHPVVPSLPSNTPTNAEVSSEVIANARKYTGDTAAALDVYAELLRSCLQYIGDIEGSVSHFDYNLPPSDDIKAILSKGINDITKYKTDILGVVDGDCDFNDIHSCGYAQALMSMDDNVSFEVAQSVGSKATDIFYQIPEITSKRSIDTLTKAIYAYNTTATSRLQWKSKYQYPTTNPFYRNIVIIVGIALQHISAIADELANKSNDVDESAKRMLSAGNSLATFASNI